LTSPTDLATVSTTPTLFWGASNGATDYTVQIATDTNFTALVVDQTGVAATMFTPAAPLNATTTYYWRVIAVNGPDSTPSTDLYRTFTTN
jgi:hypothetical protein